MQQRRHYRAKYWYWATPSAPNTAWHAVRVGWHCCKKNSPPKSALGKKAYHVVNASISGDTTAGGRARLAQQLAQHQPQVLIVELGGNDALRGLPLLQTQANLAAMTEMAQKAGARVLLLGMQVPPNYGADYSRAFAQTFADVAKAKKTALVPFLLKGVGDVPESQKWFQSDRIHPNAQAQPLLLANVWPQLVRLLR